MYTSFQLNISILSKMNWQGKKVFIKLNTLIIWKKHIEKELENILNGKTDLKLKLGVLIMESFCLGTLFYLHF